MLTNYVDETYLKGFFPELTKYYWTGETSFDKSKEKAEQAVFIDFINRGYKAAFLRPALWLKESANITATETTSAVEDTTTRLRYRYTVTEHTGTTGKTIALKGCNTETGTYTTITTITLGTTAVAETGGLITTPYKYYKLTTTLADGSLTYDFKLVETNYDLFFAYKWLEIILMNTTKEEGDQYHIKAMYFKDLYNKLWSDIKIIDDVNEDEELDSKETTIIISP